MLLKLTFNIKKWKVYFIIVAAAAAAGLIAWLSVLLTWSSIYDGVFIEGIRLSGLSRVEAKTLVDRKLQEDHSRQKVDIRYNGAVWPLSLNDISYKLQADDAVEQAYWAGRAGNVFGRLLKIAALRFEKLHIGVSADFDREKLHNFLLNIKNQIDKDGKNASVIYKNGKITVNKEVTGELLDVDKNAEIVENHIIKRNFETIDLTVDTVKPKIVYEDIKEIGNVLATFSTTFNPQDGNRTSNIKLACSKINGILLMPKEIFSMNRALGPRTLENGYMDAPVIYKGELIKGAGGGVCQVTTTLYNAVLESRQEVIERVHHSMPLGYVDPGRDATIAEDYIDFKFQNNRDYPVCICAEVVSNTLQIRILGRKGNDNSVVKLKSQVVEEYIPDGEDVIIDDSIPDNVKTVVREAKKGLRAILYRYIYDENGQLISSEKISDDIYDPVKAQIKVNRNYYSQENNLSE